MTTFITLISLLVGTFHGILQDDQDHQDITVEARAVAKAFVTDDDDTDATIRSIITMRIAEDDHSITVTERDGEIQVTLDGEDVPANRIERSEDGAVLILDEDGNVIHDMHLLTSGGEGLRQWGNHIDLEKIIQDAWGTQDAIFNVAVDVPEPTIMIGVMMDRPGDALCHHLGLDPKTTAIVAAVYEGLPAHNAGLAEHDIITGINGTANASVQSIAEVLTNASPGDALRFDILNKGEQSTVNVSVASYNAARLHQARLLGTLPVHSARRMAFIRDIDVQTETTGSMEGQQRFWLPDGERQLELFVSPDQNNLRLRLGEGTLDATMLERALGEHKDHQSNIYGPKILNRPKMNPGVLSNIGSDIIKLDQGADVGSIPHLSEFDERLERVERLLQELIMKLEEDAKVVEREDES